MRRPALPQRYRQPRNPNYPEPGFYRLRLRRGGPWVPAIIWRPCPWVTPEPWEEYTEPPDYWCRPTEVALPVWRDDGLAVWFGLRAKIGDDEADPLEVWERGYTLTPPEYYRLMAIRDWAVRWAPTAPEANPRQPVDLSKQPSLF